MKKAKKTRKTSSRPLPELASLREDHRFEQFFFDAATTQRLTRLAGTVRDPLLVCLPSIALSLARSGRPARLLDRDKRFVDLPRMQTFDLQAPDYVDGNHDLLMCDPPFANVTLDRLRETLDLLVATAMAPKAAPALAVCYISDRDAALKRAFAHHDLQAVGPPLGYRTVSASTQARIRLYLSAGARARCV